MKEYTPVNKKMHLFKNERIPTLINHRQQQLNTSNNNNNKNNKMNIWIEVYELLIKRSLVCSLTFRSANTIAIFYYFCYQYDMYVH